MRIIDAHIHFRHSYGFDDLAKEAGHENSQEHLVKTFDRLGIEHVIIMGHGLDVEQEMLPNSSYCVGFDSNHFSKGIIDTCMPALEKHLRRPDCAGIKLYPGYNKHYITEPFYHPLYDIAAQYDKPVAIHTGATASSNALLKYSHPLVVDEVATDFPKTTFVMCHIGNPWLVDSAAVLEKNPNVCADLSGLLSGPLDDLWDSLTKRPGYSQYLKTWINYPHAYDRIMYATDWPQVNMDKYIEFVQHIIEEKYWDDVFFNNANRIYHVGK